MEPSQKTAVFLPYCQSFARFFCSMVWNPCKPAVFLPYCQSFGRFFCNVVNIHRHRPIARFICNDSCFRAIWSYFDYRYRPNGEFLCNDCSYEEAPVNFETKIHPHSFRRRAPRTFWMGRLHLSCQAQSWSLSKKSPLTSSCRNRLAAWVVAKEVTEGVNMYICSLI